MFEYLINLSSQLSAADYVKWISILLVVAALLEKFFDIDVVGRRVCRLLWTVAKVIARRLCGPEYEKIVAFFHMGKKIDELTLTSIERDQSRNGRLDAIEETLATIKNEVTMNGGKSMKDAVMRLARHDNEKWAILDELKASLRVVFLRLDIQDEADKRMIFRLSPAGECTMIDPAFLRFFGYVQDDVVGADWERCIAPRSIESVRLKWRWSMEKHVKYQNEQYIVDSDGREHLCMVRGYPLVEDGVFTGFFGTVEVLEQ